MKKTIILLSIILINRLTVNSQSLAWSKDDRNNIYNDCMSYSTKFKTITNEQRESICLCFLEESTKKYSKLDYESKIDIELKRIKEAILIQCAKNIGMDLTITKTEIKEEVKTEPIVTKVPEVKETKIPTKAGLIGKWKTDDHCIIEFKEDGTFYKKYLDKIVTPSGGYIVDDIVSGDWFLDDKGIMTMRASWQENVGVFRDKFKNYTSTNQYDFKSYSADFIKFENLKYTEVATQANRIKN